MSTDAVIAFPDCFEIQHVIELVFCSGDPATNDRRYILQPAGTAEDYLSTLQRFPAYEIKRTHNYYIETTDGGWYAFYNVDCFDPPVTIIRSSSFESAYETFCDEFEHLIKVEDSDAAYYADDDRQYNSSGTHIDPSGVQGHELTLVAIRLHEGK